MAPDQLKSLLSSLPTEILQAIIRFLDPGSTVSLTLCNKTLRDAIGTQSWQALRRMRFHDFTMEQTLEIGRREHRQIDGWLARASIYGLEGNSRWTFLRGLARDSKGDFYFCPDCEILHYSATRERMLNWVLQDSTSIVVGCPEQFPAVTLTPRMIMLAGARRLCPSKYTAMSEDSTAYSTASRASTDTNLNFNQSIAVNFEAKNAEYVIVEIRFDYTITTKDDPNTPVDTTNLPLGGCPDQQNYDPWNPNVDALLKHIFAPGAGFRICTHCHSETQDYWGPGIELFTRKQLLNVNTGQSSRRFECKVCKTKFYAWRLKTSIHFRVQTFLPANQTRYSSEEIEKSFWGTSCTRGEIEQDNRALHALLNQVCPVTTAPPTDSHRSHWFHAERTDGRPDLFVRSEHSD